MKLVNIDAPAHWAIALINRDESGLNESEAACVKDWIEKQGVGWPVSMSEPFMGRHEGLLTEMASYSFLVSEQDARASHIEESAYEKAIQSFINNGGTDSAGRMLLDSELSVAKSDQELANALFFHCFADAVAADAMAEKIIAEERRKIVEKEVRKALDLQTKRRVLIVVKDDEVTAYCNDQDVETLIFNVNDYADDPENVGGVPQEFAELARQANVPVSNVS